MSFFVAVFIGLIQGLTEFLPVSSSGHLVLFYNIFNITDNTIFLSVLLHLATLFSILVVYRKDIISLIKKPFCKTNKLLLTSTIPTVVIVLLFESFIKSTFDGRFLVFGFLITAFILALSEFLSNKQTVMTKNYISKPKNNTIVYKSKTYLNSEFGTDLTKNTFTNNITNLNINYKQAFIIGIAQGCAAFPAISRSGSTIATGLLVGVNKEEMTTYSFLMSIPIIIASMLYELLSVTSESIKSLPILNLISSFIVSFIFGIIAIKFMIKIVKKQSLTNFSFYLIALSAIILIFKFI